MVQIAMKIQGSPEQSCPEWVIVDLQGNLETRQAVPLSGKFIGDLHFTQKNVPVLIIGHHILYGKVVDMEKPFAVLSKSTPRSLDQSEVKESSYIVKAIIKKRLLFKTRPKPIIAHVPKTV
ncbi:chromosome transmission fidelity protein 8 homolog [Liolophura sinensis]|uniref:chromosome transmission fidelity protein 8 homolog n=1 Tax=Liolophura sinensis TaxID=3198878 RepID=UPI00315970D0